jgi:hypothetical protein
MKWRILFCSLFFASVASANFVDQDSIPEKKNKKVPKVHPYSFSVYTLKGKVDFDDRFSKISLHNGFDTRYSWLVNKDAAWYGFHSGLQIKRVTNFGFAYYWTGGVRKTQVPELGYPISLASFRMPYYGAYLERILVIHKKAEWSLGTTYGKGKLKAEYLRTSDQTTVKEKYPFQFLEVFSNGTIHVTYFFDISGGLGYRFVLDNTQPAYVKKWVQAPFATFSVEWSFARMIWGAINRNAREVY